ncbi:uncharacterized protein K452DRAFT_311874 [Aplosporella prunicola CBS 121167]|uniref:PHD-type domain-containing protein n=1 Tax=Aplosporella prunicola CBS 121167 TaxID=1176127 RepID=A0A6A6B1N9_9PEZI|nr:uncharacterized protein K452DRAFT_311874 [Aplosporella prunicola CBS 121167]KAF2138099.1 hypothetical protein K452DRAFT_311874 [Aplosporella prunicola CBS 121167]
MSFATRITDWRLPSPNSTPKSATFPDASFQTPRTDSFSSHFLDAWSTPRANVQQTPTQTPLQPRTVTGERPVSSYSHKSLNLEDPNFHINHLSPNSHLPLPPVEQSRRLSSSPGPLPTEHGSRDNSQGYSTAVSSLSKSAMNSSQIQTPPPTRDASSSRKRDSSGLGLSFNTPSTIYSRRGSAPVGNGDNDIESAFTQTPGPLFTNLQFTPDMAQFSSTGPATAPIPAQNRLFWDSTSSSNATGIGSKPVLDDPFGFTPTRNQGAFSWQFVTPSTSCHLDSSSMPASDNAWTHTPAMVTTSSTQLQNVTGTASSAAGQDSSLASTSAAVNPSMLFSFTGSPTKQTDSFPPVQRPQATSLHKGRLPYEHQRQESQREQQIRRFSAQHSVTSTSSSAGSIFGTSKPGLQRSNSHSGSTWRPGAFTNSHQGSSAPLPRKTSPSKRMVQSSSLASISEHACSRPKTRLVVDEFGNARTETVRNQTQSPRTMDPRKRYSDLWDDGDSDDDSVASTYVPTRTASISSASALSRRNSKQGRSGSLLGRSQSVKHTKTSFGGFSFSESLSRKLGQLSTDNSPVKQRSADVSRRNSVSSLGSSFGGFFWNRNGRSNVVDDIPENGSGDAQDELKKMVEKTKLRRQETIHAANVAAQKLEAHNQRWRASADFSKMTPSQGALFDPFVDASFADPSAAGSTELLNSTLTPLTERSSASSDATRCVCNSAEWDGQLMVQCDACTKWQHASCLGLPLKPELLPPVYVCLFCTSSTPAARENRSRRSFGSHMQGPELLSPLGYKSGFQP